MDDQQGKKDQDKKDFYSKGTPSSFRDFFGPPKSTSDQQQPSPEEMFQRFQECNRGAFGTDRLRHAYMRDSFSGETVGKGNLNKKEAGPETDSCYWLQGSKEQQKRAFKNMREAVETEEKQPNGLPFVEGKRSWFPGTQDCHTMKDHAARSEGIDSYTSRIGESNTRPKVTPEEDEVVRMKIYQDKLMRAQEKGGSCKGPLWWQKKDDKGPPTGGNEGEKV